MSTFDICVELFGTGDIYEIFGVRNNSSQSESKLSDISASMTNFRSLISCPRFYFLVKKAFHQLSLEMHPDRVPDSEKNVATKKFQILTKLYGVLGNKEKRVLYDKNGEINDANDDGLPMPTHQIVNNHVDECKRLFVGKKIRQITIRQVILWIIDIVSLTRRIIDLISFRSTGSDNEKQSIRAAYLEKCGDIKHILKRVPFLSGQDEPRVRKLLNGSKFDILLFSQKKLTDLFSLSATAEWIDANLIPKFPDSGKKRKIKTSN